MTLVTLLGGGPGDPGLITLNGVEALNRADVIVYDSLVPDALLEHAPHDAERIYVGKRAGQHSLKQEEINALLVRLASEGKRVVRLKGGDPFVFGRGGEEAMALAEAGIPFQIVPGVSSTIAAPAYAGIPVTHRGVSSGFAVVTGHEDPTKEGSDLNWSALARIGTLIVVMGVGRLEQIVGQLMHHGRSAETPVALIEWGTQRSQRTVTGTLETIVAHVKEAGLGPPAAIVVGEVVALREGLSWFEKRPLFGLRVLVGRTREQGGRLSAELRDAGAEPLECPLIEIAPPSDWGPVDRAIERLGEYHWVIFTSGNGVRWFLDRLFHLGLDARTLAGASIACIGPATASALRPFGLIADIVPAQHVAEELADAIGDIAGSRILLPRAEAGRAVLPDRLRASGAKVDDIAVYRNLTPDGLASRLSAALGGVDVVTFASSSMVQHFVRALGQDRARDRLARVCTACIGPVTSATLREHGVAPTVVAGAHTIPDLVDALIRWRVDPQARTGS